MAAAQEVSGEYYLRKFRANITNYGRVVQPITKVRQWLTAFLPLNRVNIRIELLGS